MKSHLALAALVLFAGPAHSETSLPIASYQTQTQNKVLTGTIVQVSDAAIAPSPNSEIVGGVVGASAGSALGSLVPGSSIIQIASMIGAGVLGAAAGTNVATHFTAKQGQDLFIRLDNSGEVINITQPDGNFLAGDSVLIIYSAGQSRVIRNNSVPREAGV